MTAEEIEVIINSDIPSYQKSQLLEKLFNKKNESVKLCKEGNEIYQEGGKAKKITPQETIFVGDKEYKVAIADTDFLRQEGLSTYTSLGENEGMLFVYDSSQEDLWYTMEDTNLDLDIIFFNEDKEATSVHHCKALSKRPVVDNSGDAQFVLEVPINSGIEIGDELEYDFTEEEKETVSKMLVLDSNGDVQMRLMGGERIFSRVSTRKIIKAAIQAYKSDDDLDYRKVGKIVFKELNNQDNRPQQFVEK